MCILRNENDPTAKIFNNMEINYNVVKDEYKSIIGKDDFSDESSESSDGSEFEASLDPTTLNLYFGDEDYEFYLDFS